MYIIYVSDVIWVQKNIDGTTVNQAQPSVSNKPYFPTVQATQAVMAAL